MAALNCMVAAQLKGLNTGFRRLDGSLLLWCSKQAGLGCIGVRQSCHVPRLTAQLH